MLSDACADSPRVALSQMSRKQHVADISANPNIAARSSEAGFARSLIQGKWCKESC